MTTWPEYLTRPPADNKCALVAAGGVSFEQTRRLREASLDEHGIGHDK
jgi:hypothetical protein